MSKAIEVSREKILVAAAKGNAAALEFLRVFARRAHWLDDVADGDKLDLGAHYSPRDIGDHECEWLLTLSGNPFFLAHRAQLVPAMVLAINAWVDSDRFPDVQRDVIKGQWHEVVWLVAFLVGGLDHMSAITDEFRDYDIEDKGQSGNSVKEREYNGLPGR